MSEIEFVVSVVAGLMLTVFTFIWIDDWLAKRTREAGIYVEGEE